MPGDMTHHHAGMRACCMHARPCCSCTKCLLGGHRWACACMHSQRATKGLHNSNLLDTSRLQARAKQVLRDMDPPTLLQQSSPLCSWKHMIARSNQSRHAASPTVMLYQLRHGLQSWSLLQDASHARGSIWHPQAGKRPPSFQPGGQEVQ